MNETSSVGRRSRVIKIDSIDRRRSPEREKQQLAAGAVAIVGAGPGDPDLLTMRAWRLLREADVLIYDRLVSEPILALVPASCNKIFVGKRCGHHALKQSEINELLLAHASDKKRVVRLKGGDPFVFGRGGEEMQYLVERGISCQVVPGITAASGCTAYADIPLTHRDCSQVCTFVTGHLKEGRLRLPWQSLAAPNQTVVFYMGLTNAEIISWNMQEYGRDPKTPVALIERGTTPDQRVVISSLATLVEDIDANEVKAPALIVVGEVVDFHTLIANANSEIEQAAQ